MNKIDQKTQLRIISGVTVAILLYLLFSLGWQSFHISDGISSVEYGSIYTVTHKRSDTLLETHPWSPLSVVTQIETAHRLRNDQESFSDADREWVKELGWTSSFPVYGWAFCVFLLVMSKWQRRAGGVGIRKEKAFIEGIKVVGVIVAGYWLFVAVLPDGSEVVFMCTLTASEFVLPLACWGIWLWIPAVWRSPGISRRAQAQITRIAKQVPKAIAGILLCAGILWGILAWGPSFVARPLATALDDPSSETCREVQDVVNRVWRRCGRVPDRWILQEMTSPTRFIEISPGGKKIGCVFRDGSFSVSTLAGEKILHEWADQKEVRAISFGPDGTSLAVLSTNPDGRYMRLFVLKMYDLESGRVQWQRAWKGGIGSRSVSSEGSLVAADGGGGDIHLFSLDTDVTTFKIELNGKGPYRTVEALSLSPDGKCLAVGISMLLDQDDNRLILFDTATSEPVWEHSIGGRPSSVCFMDGGKRIGVLCKNSEAESIGIYNTLSGKQESETPPFRGGFDIKRLFACNDGQTILFTHIYTAYRLDPDGTMDVIERFNDISLNGAFSRDGTIYVDGDCDSGLQVWGVTVSEKSSGWGWLFLTVVLIGIIIMLAKRYDIRKLRHGVTAAYDKSNLMVRGALDRVLEKNSDDEVKQ